MDRRPGFRLQSQRLRAIVAHGVVSTGAQTPASFGFQSPGDYATCNSNHTPDGTKGGEKRQCPLVHAPVATTVNRPPQDAVVSRSCLTIPMARSRSSAARRPNWIKVAAGRVTSHES